VDIENSSPEKVETPSPIAAATALSLSSLKRRSFSATHQPLFDHDGLFGSLSIQSGFDESGFDKENENTAPLKFQSFDTSGFSLKDPLQGLFDASVFGSNENFQSFYDFGAGSPCKATTSPEIIPMSQEEQQALIKEARERPDNEIGSIIQVESTEPAQEFDILHDDLRLKYSSHFFNSKIRLGYS
jgi:hypothetical protein